MPKPFRRIRDFALGAAVASGAEADLLLLETPKLVRLSVIDAGGILLYQVPIFRRLRIGEASSGVSRDDGLNYH